MVRTVITVFPIRKSALFLVSLVSGGLVGQVTLTATFGSPTQQFELPENRKDAAAAAARTE